MATYYVWSGATGADNGSSWTDAYISFASAVTAASTKGDVIKVHKTHQEALGGATTYAFPNSIFVVCVDKDNSDALAEMDGTTGAIGSQTGAATITLSGEYEVSIYGMCFRLPGTTNNQINVGSTADNALMCEKCLFLITTTGNNSFFQLGPIASNFSSRLRFVDCTFKLYNQHTPLRPRSASCEFIGCTFAWTNTQPSRLFGAAENLTGDMSLSGCDLSSVSTNLFGTQSVGPVTYVLQNCKLASGVTILEAHTYANYLQAFLFNCTSGDEHFHVAHYNGFGETVVSSSIYANDGAEYNTTGSKYSWKIVTTAEASFIAPYVSPWIHTHNETLSAITPYLECMRDNSAGAVFQDDEVWAEFSYQGTTGFPLGVFVNDRMALLGSPADQTASSKTASDWTGETGTPGFFKIGPASSITPAEIGPLSARVCVGEPSVTVYVDPQIRT